MKKILGMVLCVILIGLPINVFAEDDIPRPSCSNPIK